MLWDYKTKHFLSHCFCQMLYPSDVYSHSPDARALVSATAHSKTSPLIWLWKERRKKNETTKNRDSNHPSKPGKLPDPWPLSPLWNVSNSVSMLVILQTSSPSRRVHWYALVSDGNKNYYACPVMTTNPLTMYLNAFHVYLQENLFALSISPFSLNDRPLREEVIYD